MIRLLKTSLLVAIALGLECVPAQAQYGWGGWGGTGQTVQGSMAAGMGAYAAGAGQYNVQTAQARSLNAQTAMQFNEYMYSVNKRNAQTNLARRQQQQKNINESADSTYRRLHDNPNAHDIHSGDALNVVLDELVNPKVYSQVVQKAIVPVPSSVVKKVNFQHAANMILISLQDVSARGIPDSLATNPAFAADRDTIRAIVAKGREQARTAGAVSPDTLREFRAAVQALKDKADGQFAQGTRQRDEADNYLKALLGLSKMLEEPDIQQFLKGLDQYPSTTMSHLIAFMHSFNLRFGAAKTAEQEAANDQIYPLLVQLRDQFQAPAPAAAPDASAAVPPPPAPDPRAAMSIFSGMPYNQLQSAPPQGGLRSRIRQGVPQ